MFYYIEIFRQKIVHSDELNCKRFFLVSFPYFVETLLVTKTIQGKTCEVSTE